VLLAIFTVIKFLADNEFRTFWAWLGLILAIATVVGAWMNMQAAGESIGDIRDRVSSMTGGGESSSQAAAPPAASTPPPAPAPPAEPAAPAPEAVADEPPGDERAPTA
jgi:hypothetical protein